MQTKSSHFCHRWIRCRLQSTTSQMYKIAQKQWPCSSSSTWNSSAWTDHLTLQPPWVPRLLPLVIHEAHGVLLTVWHLGQAAMLWEACPHPEVISPFPPQAARLELGVVTHGVRDVSPRTCLCALWVRESASCLCWHPFSLLSNNMLMSETEIIIFLCVTLATKVCHLRWLESTTFSVKVHKSA
jgi:hypothetical protein